MLIIEQKFDIIIIGISNSWVMPLFIMNGGGTMKKKFNFYKFLIIILLMIVVLLIVLVR